MSKWDFSDTKVWKVVPESSFQVTFARRASLTGVWIQKIDWRIVDVQVESMTPKSESTMGLRFHQTLHEFLLIYCVKHITNKMLLIFYSYSTYIWCIVVQLGQDQFCCQSHSLPPGFRLSSHSFTPSAEWHLLIKYGVLPQDALSFPLSPDTNNYIGI